MKLYLRQTFRSIPPEYVVADESGTELYRAAGDRNRRRLLHIQTRAGEYVGTVDWDTQSNWKSCSVYIGKEKIGMIEEPPGEYRIGYRGWYARTMHEDGLFFTVADSLGNIVADIRKNRKRPGFALSADVPDPRWSFDITIILFALAAE